MIPYGRRAAVLGLAACAALAATGTASACTIDGKATALANGHRAAASRDLYSTATAKSWAPFTFTQHYRAGQAIRLSEDLRQLRPLFTKETLRHPWRWDFGDGTSRATGWAVTHRYRHTGTYRIVVSAYYPSWKSYLAFDTVRITIASR